MKEREEQEAMKTKLLKIAEPDSESKILLSVPKEENSRRRSRRGG